MSYVIQTWLICYIWNCSSCNLLAVISRTLSTSITAERQLDVTNTTDKQTLIPTVIQGATYRHSLSHTRHITCILRPDDLNDYGRRRWIVRVFVYFIRISVELQKLWHIIIKYHVYHRIKLKHVICSCSFRFRRSWCCRASLRRRSVFGGFRTGSQSFWARVSRLVRARQAPVYLNPTLIFTNLYYLHYGLLH
jgi:hypothetical protein